MASDVRIALYTTSAGFILALVGIIMILIALFGTRYRAPWFQAMLWILPIVWLLSFPLGTILGVVVIVYLVNHKTEFTEQSPASDSGKAAADSVVTGAHEA